MPDIVKFYGVNLVDDVVKIGESDVPVTPPPKPKREPGSSDFDPVVFYDLDELPPEEEDLREGQPDTDEEEMPEEQEEKPPASPDAAETVSPVQGEIIQGAMAEASRILEDALKNAEATRAEMLANVQYEAEQMRQEAIQEGRKQGLASVMEEVQGFATNIEQAVARFEGERAGFEMEYEEQLQWLAMEIASKVLAKKVAQDDAEMTEMVAKVVQGVKNEPWIRVEVSSEMTNLISKLLALFANMSNIEVESAPTAPGTVMVETPSGMIDASLKTQLENLKGYFEQAGQPGKPGQQN